MVPADRLKGGWLNTRLRTQKVCLVSASTFVVLLQTKTSNNISRTSESLLKTRTTSQRSRAYADIICGTDIDRCKEYQPHGKDIKDRDLDTVRLCA